MEQRPPRVPKLAWVEEEEEGPGAAPEEQPAEVEQFQLPQEDAALDRTQEQDGAHGRFRRAAQVPAAIPSWAGLAVAAQPSTALGAPHGTSLSSLSFVLLLVTCKFIECVWQEETSIMGTGSMENCDVYSTDTSAAMLDLLEGESVSSLEQVPAMVRDIHQWLMANDSGEQSLDRTLLELAEAHPADVGITLLRVAPSCDRAATTMWKTIMSSPMTAEPALLLLLDVLGSWPEHSTRTSDGDNTDVFALAATVVMWKILQVPCVPQAVTVYLPRLFVHLLFQVFFSTGEMPEEVDDLWRVCRKEHGLPTNPSRFALQTLRALLCLEYEDMVTAMDRKRGWDALLCADTQHDAVALLAREVSCVSIPLCSGIALHLLGLLSAEEPRWDLPALAFLVEVLECLDLRECGGSVVEISSKYLQSERRQMRRLALRALLVLRDDPSMAERTWSLTESLVKLLWDTDGEIVGMTLVVLGFLFLDKDILVSSPIALQLAEALLPLFENDDNQVQRLSMILFREMMDFLAEEGEKHVQWSLLPLFFRCHDENRHVAWASWATLLRATEFLKRRDLTKRVEKQKLWMFAKCLLAVDRSRVIEYVRRALPYLYSPQEFLRRVAARFIVIAGQSLTRQQGAFGLICQALEHMRRDVSPAIRSLALQTLFALGIADTGPYPLVQRLQDQLRRAGETRPRLPGLGCLRFWSSVWR
ncbi:uncharacterized protein LOC116446882 isoform X2 [Corvus moneduloides]|uniref:uncharacterized protein LOC116446882 isoform X2 n=1 Tax=Corvus moneduloides TaxID=1196302 RepID=UPI00136436F7|nr:uncharacterized protein LOC116446882 isoform X2 [Corvus moneduloides]